MMNRENDMTDSRYTPELAAEICKRVSEGSPLRQVCRDDDIAVLESSVRQWVRDDRNGFAPQFAQARSMQIDCWADEILTVAYREDLDPADKRVITENLRWLLSKLAPTRYGDVGRGRSGEPHSAFAQVGIARSAVGGTTRRGPIVLRPHADRA
jgi:hypothetical protein